MSDAHGRHFEAVGFASLKIEEAQATIYQAGAQMEEALGAVYNAVGDDPVIESASNASAWTAHMKDVLLPELLRTCENVKAELNRYGGGF